MKPCTIEQLRDELNANDIAYGPVYHIGDSYYKGKKVPAVHLPLKRDSEHKVYTYYCIDIEEGKRVFMKGYCNKYMLNLSFNKEPDIHSIAKKIIRKIRYFIGKSLTLTTI